MKFIIKPTADKCDSCTYGNKVTLNNDTQKNCGRMGTIPQVPITQCSMHRHILSKPKFMSEENPWLAVELDGVKTFVSYDEYQAMKVIDAQEAFIKVKRRRERKKKESSRMSTGTVIHKRNTH